MNQEKIETAKKTAEKIGENVKNLANSDKLKEQAQHISGQISQNKDQIISGAQQAAGMIKDQSKKIIEIGGDALDKGADLYHKGEEKLSNLEQNIINIEHKIEDKFEYGEQKIKQYSKKLRFFAAVFFFPVWFSFHILIHTTLATWDIFVSVYRKIDPEKTGKKIIYSLSMCCFGCGVMQVILFVMSIFNLRCKEFKQEQTLQDGFIKLACETNSDAAQRLEQSLTVFFGNYQPVPQEQSNQMVELDDITPGKSQSNLNQQLIEKK